MWALFFSKYTVIGIAVGIAIGAFLKTIFLP